MSLNIETYSGRDRQHAKQIMQQCSEAKLDLQGCIDAVYTDSKNPGQPGKRAIVPSRVKKCPSCKKGNLHKVIIGENDNNTILGCRKCYYSEEIK